MHWSLLYKSHNTLEDVLHCYSVWVIRKECPLRYQLTALKSKFAQKKKKKKIQNFSLFIWQTSPLKYKLWQLRIKIMSMLALLLEFTSKCKNYCRIITDYASFSMEIQHLVHLHRHICVIEALKSQTSRENLTLQEMRTIALRMPSLCAKLS